ncbi:MAG: cytidine deaminase [Lentimicrobiaceae bacterium]|jgi:cytidine deaminase|nr:cytidine deaminase [Lentimicrobiaceae bacterium]
MQNKQLVLSYQIFELSELSQSDCELLTRAREVAKNAYAPYSHFKVGAAVLLENSEIVVGCNQENAAYPSGLCAERIALFSAYAQFPMIPVDTIAITAIGNKSVIEEPISPCGSCRQVITEFESISKRPIRILMQGEKGAIMCIDGASTMLPFMFAEDVLKRYTKE